MTEHIQIEKFLQGSFLGTNPNGILKTNRFFVEINCPTINLTSFGFNVFGFSDPGVTVKMGSQMINGLYQWYYKEREDEEFTISYMESADLQISRTFYQWIELFYDQKTKIRKYAESIKSDVKVYPLTGTGQKTSSHHLYQGVLPYSISGIPFMVEDVDVFTKIDIKFKYVTHEIF